MIDRHTLASLIIDVRWRGGEAHHREMYFARRVNFWRDLLPERLTDALMGKSDGERLALTFPAGEVVPLHRDDHVLGMQWDEFRGVSGDGPERPRIGRFYPWGLLRNIAGIYPEDVRPFRVSGTGADGFRADLNHPLSGYSLDVTVTVQKTLQRGVERGGSVIDWFSEVLDSGPGMQARCAGKPTDFGGLGACRRQDESDDAIFYRSPRIIGHIDRHANSMLEKVYGDVLRKGRVLDLMSSVESHLPPDRKWQVTGLGMNREEMAENHALEGFVVHDLNADPVLPFPDGSFEAVICSLSVEYLVRPAEVFREAARVLTPGGPFVVSFSNRWFPDKARLLWPSLHEFERVGLVLDHFLQSGVFRDLHTFSARNWYRPEDDPHFSKQRTSDPVYVVWGHRI